ncbi:MAG: hypothetical protein KIT24_12925, partial [Phycisphaeraceae bacterium]|nr:hypothetical protein [Phycisphaeraceae bacterium]
MGEFSYTAYGELLTAASHHAHIDPRLGHKGLFLDRLDTGVVDPLTGAEVARHALGAKHTYFMVNRSYDPQLGRFLQRDPNATGLPLIAEAIYTGSALGGGVNAFGLDSHIVDGVGVYGYVTSNPWTKSDPLGLAPEDDLYNLLREEFLGDLPEFDDPFDQADAIGFQHAMSGVMAVQRSLSKTSRLMKHVRAYESIGWAWAELVMDRDAGILTGMVIGPFFSRICFEEGTLVAVPGGTETIESLSLGDRVLSYQDPHALGGEAVILPAASEIVCITLTYRHEDGETTTMEMLRPAAAVGRLGLFPGRRLAVHLPEMGIRGTAVIEGVEAFAPSVRTDVPVVTGHFVTSQAEVVDLFLEGEGRPIGVTPGHPFFSLDRAAWVGASELRQGERLASLRGEVRVQEVVPRPERV